MLKADFADHRVCSHCGAPAQRLGFYIDTDAGPLFKAAPAEHRRGSFTHTCTRNNMESPDGKVSSDPQYRYACSALTRFDTREVAPEAMFRRCHVGDSMVTVPDLPAELERQRAAAGDVE